MYKLKLLFAVFFPGMLAAQQESRFALSLQVQPELTFHKDNYSSFRLDESKGTATFNTGAEVLVNYALTPKIVAGLGLGFISRKINALVYLNQNILPPLRGSPSSELVGIGSVRLRTLQVPFWLGYRFLETGRQSCYVQAGLTGNYLLNTYYDAGSLRYTGSVQKKHWQGISLLLGMGADHSLSKKIKLTGRLAYSLINTVKEDIYLFSQDEDVIDQPHTYLNLSAGVKILL